MVIKAVDHPDGFGDCKVTLPLYLYQESASCILLLNTGYRYLLVGHLKVSQVSNLHSA